MNIAQFDPTGNVWENPAIHTSMGEFSMFEIDKKLYMVAINPEHTQASVLTWTQKGLQSLSVPMHDNKAVVTNAHQIFEISLNGETIHVEEFQRDNKVWGIQTVLL